MSNFDSLSTQPDWRDQYSPFPLLSESGLLQPPFEQPTSSDVSDDNQSQQQSGATQHLEHRHNARPLRQDSQSPKIIEQVDSTQPDSTSQINNPVRNDLLVSTKSTALASAKQPSPTASTPPQQVTAVATEKDGDHADLKEEGDDEEDDDEMLDAEEESSIPQTAAERRAERRKMKRFRLTHQQTRFLMSEFAKQAHPDAAHRERLSREIPGLSPRQVQVWFQNRRAKIKRLTADDRERMMKMRAVPDDFDNVQALHSPYGAVQGVNTPMQSPVDFVPHYADHMMRPLMVDTMRRNENDDHISPTGLNLAFGQSGFHAGGGMSSTDGLSPLSLNSTDRYYSSHLSSPMSAGPRSANHFDRQNNYQSISNSRQQTRSLQPLQLRETMSRTRSETLNSPLRSSMSWKGETLDYGSYQAGQQSPQLSGRQQSIYRPDQSGNNTVNTSQYDGSTYSGTSIQGSPPHIPCSPPHGPSTSLQQASPSTMSRVRASSLAFPSSLNVRNQYRGLTPQHNSSHGVSSAQRRSSFTSPFTTSYASAPLTAPIDFALPRIPIEGAQSRGDFNAPQLSTPMVPQQDFRNSYASSLSPTRVQLGDRDFGNQGPNTADILSQGQVGDHQTRSHEGGPYLGHGDYKSGQKRKRSFTINGTFDSP